MLWPSAYYGHLPALAIPEYLPVLAHAQYNWDYVEHKKLDVSAFGLQEL